MNRKKRFYPIALSIGILTAPLTVSSLTVEATTKQTVSPQITTGHSFIDQISPDVVRLSSKYGIYASVMIAQTILESNYGKSGLSQAPIYNLFGMKGKYNGQGATFQTKEYKKDGTYQIRATFKKYTSYTASLEDYADLIRNGLTYSPNYYAGAWKENTTSYKDATAVLAGTYASDLDYSKKLNRIIERYELTRFDQLQPVAVAGDVVNRVDMPLEKIKRDIKSGEEAIRNANKSTKILYKPTKYYYVKKGDSLTSIALRQGITTAQLKKWNGLNHATIKIKQRLVVSVEGSVNQVQKTKKQMRYVIQEGDSLASVATKFRVTEAYLMTINQLDSPFVYSGQIIYLQKK